jgi:zona occludens toxin (predicted ATPase)
MKKKEGAINHVYLDLERPSDLAKLDNAEWFLGSQKGKLVCIDEIQRKPELFP